MLIHLSRDSVAAGDDVESHDDDREVDGRRPLERFVWELFRDHYLPRVGGERVTWVLRKARNGEALGVFSTRWGDPEPLILIGRRDMDLIEVGDTLHFEYAASRDTGEVLGDLRQP